jgi:hypothetical protein
MMCSRRSSGGSFFGIQSVLSELLLDENVLIITHTMTLVMRVFVTSHDHKKAFFSEKFHAFTSEALVKIGLNWI